MAFIQRSLLLILLAALIAGCGAFPISGFPAAAASAYTATPAAPRYVVPVDATPTATPFQPVLPTAAFLPTQTPYPSLTPLAPTPTFTPPPQISESQAGTFSDVPRQVNILLLGADQRPGWEQFRTDAIILATLNSELGTVNLTSFPRDLYVTMPGYGSNRINTAYQFGGWELLRDTMEYNFGVRPDHFVLINFGSFKRIIDSWGGLDVDVAVALVDTCNDKYLSVPAGTVHMDADIMLCYARSRKTTNDFARGRRQQEVLRAIFEKLLTLDAVKRVPEFYNIYKDNVTTDLGLTDIISLLPLAAKMKDSSHLHHYYIGPDQIYDWITPDGGMVLLPRPDAIQEVLQEALNAR